MTNPVLQPLPAGARILAQGEVTPAIEAWAVDVLHHTPLGHVAGPQQFGALSVVGRVEVHSWFGADPSKPSTPHPGTTCYAVPAAAAAAVRAQGTDVSAFQPPPLNWGRFAGTGGTFAVVKAVEGITALNPHLAAQIAGAREAGLVLGAYLYFRTTSDPIAQAQHFFDLAEAVDVVGPGALPLSLDVEELKDLVAVGPERYADAVRACLDELARLGGRTPQLYIAPGYADRFPDRDFASVAKLWVAHYGVATPRLPWGFKEWAMWQTSGTAREEGITDRGDADVFAGSVDELRAYAAGGAAPTGGLGELVRLTELADDVDAGKEGLG